MPEPCFPEGDSRLHRGYYLGFAAVAVLGFIVPAFSRALWNPDEPRVASIGSAMARPGGDLLVPRLNGEPFLQEPPLYHWLTALSCRLFGAGPGRDWVPRLPAMAFALGTLLLLWFRGGQILGRRGGLLA